PQLGSCDRPLSIPAQGGTVTGTTNDGLSKLSGSDSCGYQTYSSPELVYQWTPNFSGIAAISTCNPGTTLDTVLYVRQGTCSTGTQIDCDDDVDWTTCRGASQLHPTVTSGETYFIVVDGHYSSGTFVLTAGQCIPASCAAQGMNCGSLSDGCGNTINCGTCS